MWSCVLGVQKSNHIHLPNTTMVPLAVGPGVSAVVRFYKSYPAKKLMIVWEYIWVTDLCDSSLHDRRATGFRFTCRISPMGLHFNQPNAEADEQHCIHVNRLHFPPKVLVKCRVGHSVREKQLRCKPELLTPARLSNITHANYIIWVGMRWVRSTHKFQELNFLR